MSGNKGRGRGGGGGGGGGGGKGGKSRDRGGRGGSRGGRGGDYYKNKYGGKNKDNKNAGASGDNGKKTGDSGGGGSASPHSFDPNVPRPGGNNGGDYSSLLEIFRRLDGKQYPHYRDIESSSKGWVNDTEGYSLYIGRAQSDPFAKPTRCRVIIKSDTANFPSISYQNKIRSVALGDYLNRVFFDCCNSMGANLGAREGDQGGGNGHGGGGWSGPKGGDIEVRSSVRYVLCAVSFKKRVQVEALTHIRFCPKISAPTQHVIEQVRYSAFFVYSFTEERSVRQQGNKNNRKHTHSQTYFFFIE